MLKKFTILLFCGFLAIISHAQDFGGGIIAGISTSQVSGDQLGGFNKVGFLVGAFTKKSISQLLSVQMEMTYIQKGSNNPKMNKNQIQDISISYIEVPISVNYYQTKMTSFEVGIQTAFLLNFSDNDLYGQIPNNQSTTFNKVDLGAFIGISHDLTDKIKLNSRISNSILPVRPHASGVIYKLNKGQYNSVLSFTLHYNL